MELRLTKCLEIKKIMLFPHLHRDVSPPKHPGLSCFNIQCEDADHIVIAALLQLLTLTPVQILKACI